jgi:hypothetical protein
MFIDLVKHTSDSKVKVCCELSAEEDIKMCSKKNSRAVFRVFGNSLSEFCIQSSSINRQRVGPEHCLIVMRVYQIDGHRGEGYILIFYLLF